MNLTLQGSLTVSPPSVSETTFPGSVSDTLLSTTPSPKPSAVCSGIKSRNINSPSTFATLTGVGVGDDVSQGDTLYFKCRSPMVLRVTTANPILPGSPLVSLLPICGTIVWEVPQSSYITLLEVQGVGQAEYLVSGQQ